MDAMTAQHLSELTTEFYRRVGASFSATRQAPWEGWERLLDVCQLRGAPQLTVLDLACGNLRFEKFLADHVGSVTAYGVDATLDMFTAVDMAAAADSVTAANTAPAADFAAADIVATADIATGGRANEGLRCSLQELDLTVHPEQVAAPPCDLCVSFGFMHHLPLFEQRERLLRALVEHVRPGGYVAVAFWQFADDPRQLAKARPVEGGGPRDYVMGWQGSFDVVRYCHHADDEEIDELVARMEPIAHEVARFSADGKTHALNRYVVLRKSE